MEIKKSVKIHFGKNFEWIEVGTEKKIEISETVDTALASAQLFESTKNEVINDAINQAHSLNMDTNGTLLAVVFRQAIEQQVYFQGNNNNVAAVVVAQESMPSHQQTTYIQPPQQAVPVAPAQQIDSENELYEAASNFSGIKDVLLVNGETATADFPNFV